MKKTDLIPLIGISISHFFHKAKEDELEGQIRFTNIKITTLTIINFGVLIWLIIKSY